MKLKTLTLIVLCMILIPTTTICQDINTGKAYYYSNNGNIRISIDSAKFIKIYSDSRNYRVTLKELMKIKNDLHIYDSLLNVQTNIHTKTKNLLETQINELRENYLFMDSICTKKIEIDSKTIKGLESKIGKIKSQNKKIKKILIPSVGINIGLVLLLILLI